MGGMKETRTPLEELSKRVFNSERRLDIADALMAQNGLVGVAEITRSTGASSSTVYDELNLLVGLGVVQRVTPDRTVLYQRVNGPFWAWCRELIEQTVSKEPAQGQAR
jgi:Fe2+ or Zn2+ uptake regulation protein